MRVLVTGSREWADWELLRDELNGIFWNYNEPITIVHGDCPTGADAMAKRWVAGIRKDNIAGVGVSVLGQDLFEELHPADWSRGKRAGPERNQEMVDLGADLCIAFYWEGAENKGTNDCATRAADAGIPVRTYTSARREHRKRSVPERIQIPPARPSNHGGTVSNEETNFLSLTVKDGDYQNTAFTIHSSTPAEFQDAVLNLLGEKDGTALLDRVLDMLKRAPRFDLVNKDGGGKTESKRGGGFSGRKGGGSKRRRDDDEDDPERPDGPAPECKHGEKNWVNPSNKPWKGWFCPEGGRSGDCKTTWVNDDD